MFRKKHNGKSRYTISSVTSHAVVREGNGQYSPSATRAPRVALTRRYGLLTVQEARAAATEWLVRLGLQELVTFGLPEVDDRYHIWRVPLLKAGTKERVGEAVIDARSSLLLTERSTAKDVLEARLYGKHETARIDRYDRTIISSVRNTVICGDCEVALGDLPAESVGLIFTSPPYYNARPEYEDYLSYEDYLLKMRKVLHNCHRVLGEGRFFVLNVSPVLIRRVSRGESSKRLAVPFDFHRLFIEEGYDFVDDIIWEKPEGAGWATGRGRRFAADRTPLQYKPVPVTEYVLVYRKHTERLIDWNIRCHHDQEAVHRSKITDPYERTNIWKLSPAHSKVHPAVFPLELAQQVVAYYSFEHDAVLDPFAGVGTTGRAAISLRRRFILIENEPRYIDYVREHVVDWLGQAAKDILWVNCPPPEEKEAVLF
ncbi:MAG: site-specific DNA-methyltransferase [Candidatus Omnitrophica bacterium]|nr:site-specific DNA-methyltransferase [Candidatus Omnitrophota bacterium]